MKKKWRRQMVECVGYERRMILNLKRSSHYWSWNFWLLWCQLRKVPRSWRMRMYKEFG